MSASAILRRGNPAEPADLPFNRLDNIMITPHASASMDGFRPHRNRTMAENVNRLARAEPLINVIRAAEARR
jgi:phosphoglycerate dehydrogenase-like enzyme